MIRLLFSIFAQMWRAIRHSVTAILIMTLFLGCENDIERISILTNEGDTPNLKGSNIEVIYSDSARVKVQILAPAYQQFVDVERPYMEFQKGLEVYFYNSSGKIESEIRADYAVYYTRERLWHATGNVVAQRLNSGDALNTEELFWNEEKEFIYSDSYTRIQNEDGIFYGKRGFESNQNLSNWQLKGSSGTVNVKDEE